MAIKDSKKDPLIPMNLNQKYSEIYARLLVDCRSRAGFNACMVDLLELYVFNLQEAGKLAEKIEKEGSTYQHTNKAGFKNLATNPRARMYFLYCSQALKLATALNLTSSPDVGKIEKKKGFDLDLFSLYRSKD